MSNTDLARPTIFELSFVEQPPGVLGDGERLPTVRQTARDFGAGYSSKSLQNARTRRIGRHATAAGTRVRALHVHHEKSSSNFEHLRPAGERIPVEDLIAILRSMSRQPITPESK